MHSLSTSNFTLLLHLALGYLSSDLSYKLERSVPSVHICHVKKRVRVQSSVSNNISVTTRVQ
jgi:hypothetical protein